MSAQVPGGTQVQDDGLDLPPGGPPMDAPLARGQHEPDAAAEVVDPDPRAARRPAHSLDPSHLLRTGSVDPVALLVLRCLRKVVYPLGFVGLTIAWESGDFNAEAFAQLTTPTQYLDTLLSPLVVIAVALGLRVVVAATGFLVALPLALDAWVPGTEARTWSRRLWDRYYLATGYATARWTWAVHRAAVRQAGFVGSAINVVEIVVRVALPISITVFVLDVLYGLLAR